MGSVSGESSIEWDSLDSSAHDEKIFLAVRLRPLNERELGKNDFSEWECINNTTIIFKNCLQERSMSPTAYTFNRVFGPDCPTRQVYKEAAKKIALSVLSGINSSIFTYGQTSSGKTYTMSGITEYAVADIYDYIDKHREREFALKFSAMEIYNEVVKDLLSSDGTPLRLLDDPMRGSVVDKLTEVTLRDSSHLKEMLSICQSQRRTGETSLNEMSSRSHQILCLTVESEAREYLGAENSSTLTASVNFVDLAGSERASQTHSAGTRLKEGCHINRSLLTLGTVIRKLSKGRNGHIPFRDSKLTRILQHSLGGNARTAIICTMSPAHSHVEQSRSTLSFATCAKQISTNAQVNIVMSEKALVRQLRREIARLENELRSVRSLAASCDLASALKDKELIIEKLDEEIRQLTHQRDIAQARVEEMFRSGGAFHTSKSLGDLHNNEKGSWSDGYSPSETSEITDPLHSNVSSRTSPFSDRCDSISSRLVDHFTGSSEDQFLSDNTSPLLYIDKYFGPESPDPGWAKVVQEASNKLEDYYEDVPCIEINFTERNTVATASLPHVQDTNSGISPCSSEEEISDQTVAISNSPTSEVANRNKTPSQNEADNEKLSIVEDETKSENLRAYNSHCSITSDVLNERDETIKMFIEEIKIKQQEFADDLDQEDGKLSSDKVQNITRSASDWYTEFERQQKEIIELWDFCNIPLVYRTYFFLLFQGDPSDTAYMEVELRRLSFLKKKLHGIIKDDQVFTHASSKKALDREREMLSKQMLSKFTSKERKALYKKWGIDLKTKQRRSRLCRLLWTDITNMEHIKESAAIVAKLVGFTEPGNVFKEMIALNFSAKPKHHRSFSWRHSLS